MEFITKNIISKDGTSIGYRQTGSGPGLIICHGGGRISQNYQKLALALAGEFTVYIPDRRGRGLSAAEGGNYNLQKAVEDLSAVIDASAASFIFGHSAGGLIALETMRTKPVKKIALYEPPVSVNGSLPSEWLAAFENALTQKKLKKAMAISLKGLKVHEGINKMPFAILLLLINILTLIERKKERGTRMSDLLHTLPADMKMAMLEDSKFSKYNVVTTETLLMYGSESPAYFAEGIRALENTLPRFQTVALKGFDHYSPEEKTEEIASILKRFFNENTGTGAG